MSTTQDRLNAIAKKWKRYVDERRIPKPMVHRCTYVPSKNFSNACPECGRGMSSVAGLCYRCSSEKRNYYI